MVKLRFETLAGLFLCSLLFLHGSKSGSLNKALSEDLRKFRTLFKTTIRKPNCPVELDTVALILNTPMSGTSSLTHSFARSFGCKKDKQFHNVDHHSCENGKDVLRTDHPGHGSEALATIRPCLQERNKCIVVTSIRNPRTWLPAMFMNSPSGGRKLCHADVSQEYFFEKYREWIMTEIEDIREKIMQVRPTLLEHFGSSGLTDEFKKMDTSGGYSLLNNPDPLGSFNNCELLFLRMEDAARWPEIVEKVVPGVRYKRLDSKSEVNCPEVSAHYHALQNYEYTLLEKYLIIGGNKDIEEYFNVYGLIDGK
mmetsp:Transcript_11377/g.17609  ORF Transcript_11377/g.17609 Transcript_11377/m.17609 type:complete len:310 (+) Transcript_11377:124-1053(+)